MWRWESTGDTYRTVLSYWTPVPEGKEPLSYAAMSIYQINPFSWICGTELRLLTNNVPGQPRHVWDWVGEGELFLKGTFEGNKHEDCGIGRSGESSPDHRHGPERRPGAVP